MIRAEKVVERRRHERLPLMLDAEVFVGDDVIGCVVFDLSPGGAKVRLTRNGIPAEDAPPEDLVLHIPPFGGFEGEISWRDDEYIGIQFFDAHKTMVKLIVEKATGKPA